MKFLSIPMLCLIVEFNPEPGLQAWYLLPCLAGGRTLGSDCIGIQRLLYHWHVGNSYQYNVRTNLQPQAVRLLSLISFTPAWGLEKPATLSVWLGSHPSISLAISKRAMRIRKGLQGQDGWQGRGRKLGTTTQVWKVASETVHFNSLFWY